jgi:hypothetical protein
MKISLMSSAICMVVLTLLAAGCTSAPPEGAVPSVSPNSETPVVETTPAPTLSPICEFTSCHGLDLTCGPNPPEVCTGEDQLGDKCRQYAFCSKTDDTCQLVTTPRFDTCKSCVEKCTGINPAELLSCEELC